MVEDRTRPEEVKRILELVNVTGKEADDFTDFYLSLPYMKSKEILRDNVLFVYSMMGLFKIQHDKESGYGNSWEKRGDIGVFFNVARKWDRLENIILGEGKVRGDEAIQDTIEDICVYMGLWTTKILREKFEK